MPLCVDSSCMHGCLCHYVLIVVVCMDVFAIILFALL